MINYKWIALVLFFLVLNSTTAQDTLRVKRISEKLLQEQKEEYQKRLNDSDLISKERTFKNIQNRSEKFYSTRDKGKGSGYKQWKRWENDMKDRLNTDGEVINYSKYLNDIAKKRKKDTRKSLTGDWKNIGPKDLEIGPNAYAPGLGRVNCIAFHPIDANTFYIGAPAGGLWKTTDGGVNWTELAQDFPQLGVSGIAINPNNGNEIYILTGDGDGSIQTPSPNGAGFTTAIGIFKSTDGGSTWTNTTLPWGANDVVSGYKLLMHPSNSSILFAATTQGLYKTINGGTSWTLTQAGVVHDFEFQPQDPSKMYLSNGNTYRLSTNSGDSFNAFITMSGANRIALAVTPQNPMVVYMLCGPGRNDGTAQNPIYKFRGIYKSSDGGISFNWISDSPNILSSDKLGQSEKDQSAYDLAIAASRTSNTNIIIGGVNVWSSANSGLTWTNRAHWDLGRPANLTLPYVHADIHALDINPLNNKLYAGTDGGIYVSDDFGITWTNLSKNISVSMFYRIDGIESNADLIIMGAQDNGTNLWQGKPDTVKSLFGGDGMTCRIDPNNENQIYFSAQNGYLARSFDQGGSVVVMTPSGSNSSAWITPFDLDPNNSNILFAAIGNKIYKTSTAPSTKWNSGWSSLTVGSDRFRFIHVAKSNSYVYFCTDKKIYKSPSNLTANSLVDITSNLPVHISGVNITSITTHHNDGDYIIVSLSGMSSGNKVFVSTNGGTSWSNFSGNLPNVPINVVEYARWDNYGVFLAGTDLGLYMFHGSLSDWIQFDTGMPNVSVRDIEVNNGARRIYAATFGRGLWYSDFYYDCPEGLFLFPANDPSAGLPGYTYDKVSSLIFSSRSISGAAANVIYQAEDLIILQDGFRANESATLFKAVLNPCWIDDPGN